MSIEDPRLSSFDNNSSADDFDSAVEQHLGYVPEETRGVEMAQAATPNATDAAKTDRLPTETAAASIPTEVVPDQNNVVTLPVGVSIDDIRLEGGNLVLVQADGTEIVIVGGAANIPTFVIGEVELPQQALFAALEGNNINVAAGPDGSYSASSGSASNGGDFNDSPINNGPEQFALADLLGDTDFGDGAPNGQRLGGDGVPTILSPLTSPIILDEAVVTDEISNDRIFTGRLPFEQGPDFGTISGVVFTGASDVDEGDGLKVLTGFTSGGRPITVTSFAAPTDGADLDFLAVEGRDSAGNVVFTLTITNRVTGDFTFELVGKLEHPDAGQNGSQDDLDDLLRLGFQYTVTDRDGDSVTGSFNIDIQDDAPTIGVPAGDQVSEDDLFSKIDEPTPEFAKFISDSESDSGSDFPPAFKYPTAEGSLAIRWGADNDLKSETIGETGNATGDDPVGRTVSFTGLNTSSTSAEIQAAIPVLANLSSDGYPLTYRIEYKRDESGKWNGGYQLIAFKAFFDGPFEGERLFAEDGEAGQLISMKDFDGARVFVITLDPTSANGTYTFQLIGNLDHYAPIASTEGSEGQAAGNTVPSDSIGAAVVFDGDGPRIVGKPVDFLDFKIPFTATDSDGDRVDGTVTVRVEDDGPWVGSNSTVYVEDDDLSNG
ncbi:DUF5801 repeats-in-toxin domain-containing protein, partial [Rhizobium wuzhouense]